MRIAVAYSGGKDSTWLLLYALRLGHEPVAVCVDTGFLSPVAWRNIIEVPNRLGVERVIISRPAVFREIYRRHLPTLGDKPFLCCVDCHWTIYQIAAEGAINSGCGEVWTGLTPDETALMPEGDGVKGCLARLGPYFRAPLCTIADYDPARIRADIRRAGLRIVTSPLRTNCAFNMVMLHDYYRRHGTSCYGPFFARQPRLRRTLDVLLRLGYWSGWLRWKRNRVVNEIRSSE